MQPLRPALAALFLLLPALPAHAMPPEGTVEIRQTGPHTSGPNCWNGALVETHVLQHHRFLTDKEFLYLVANSCTERQGPPQSGDLGRVWLPAGREELHGFVWLAPNLVFAKNSDQASEQYVTMTYESMWHYYWTKRECKIDQAAQNTAACKSRVQYYACHPPTGALAAQLERLQPINTLVEELIFSPATEYNYKENCSSASFLARNQIVIRLQSLFAELAKEKPLDAAYLSLWLDSVRSQIYDSEVSARSYNCRKQMSYVEKYTEYSKLQDSIDIVQKQLQAAP